MDKLFIFSYKGKIVITWGLTGKERLSLETIRGLNHKAVLTGKSVGMFNRVMNKSLRSNPRTIRLVSSSKKRFAGRYFSCRTANRHRWAGREYQGEWEKKAQGTRQNNWA